MRKTGFIGSPTEQWDELGRFHKLSAKEMVTLFSIVRYLRIKIILYITMYNNFKKSIII